jgi:Putative mono-oxygenase ydhR
MLTSITRFPFPVGTQVEEMRKAFEEFAPFFSTLPGLVRKYFLIAEDGQSGGGVYLWESLADAKVFESQLRQMVREHFGVEPSITYFETPVIAERTETLHADAK